METTNSPLQGVADDRLEPTTTPTPWKSARTRIERSCVMCHQRKIRCDKRSPCSNCARADLFCCYPEPERAGRRPPKTTIAELANRVARLERTIIAISDGTSQDQNGETESARTPQSENLITDKMQTSEVTPAEELLIQDGYSSRYVNEVLLSRILDEERELKSIIGTPKADSSVSEGGALFSIGAIFSGFNETSTAGQDYRLSRFQASQLWQAFVNNVDPIVKILHIPTTQATVFAAINNPTNIDKDLEALLFSIYFAAITSLPADTVAHLLNQPKNDALRNFKCRIEQCLAGANILDTPSIRSLQAMAIYLTCLRVYHGDRSIWTMYGLAVRSAQSIGLHRDGKNFNMSPFETEMRRRLWWNIASTDSRAAEDHGIFLISSEGSSDTQYPLNIDDRELSPDMQVLPVAKLRWTEMTFPLIIIETTRVLQQLHQTPATSFNAISSEANKIKVVNDLVARFETTYLSHCDHNIPIEQATILMSRMMTEKLSCIIRLQSLKRSDFENNTPATEETLSAACKILELYLEFQLNDLLGKFHWLSERFAQYHMLTYLLWHLCVRPVGPSVVKTWDIVNKTFEVAIYRNSSAVGSKWEVLRLLKEKAIQAREVQIMGSSMENAATDNLSALHDLSGESRETSDFTFGDAAHWDMTGLGIPDWNNLVGNFDMGGSDI